MTASSKSDKQNECDRSMKSRWNTLRWIYIKEKILLTIFDSIS